MSIDVQPGERPGKLPVATMEIGGIHYPVYFLSNEDGKIAYVDQFSGAVGTLTQEHLKTHEGKFYEYWDSLTISNTGGIQNYLLVMDATTYPHFRRVEVVSTDAGPFNIDIFESTTTSANGTAGTILNRNRNSSNTAMTSVYKGPTITADGTQLDHIIVPASRQTGGIGVDSSEEWNLKVNTKSCIRVTNNTGGAGTGTFTVKIFWYE